MYQHARAIDASRRREFLQQEKCQHSIGDNSRRDFHPQVIDDRSCRDMLQQEHLKSQQAIDASRRRAMLQQQHSIDGFAVELCCNSSILSTRRSIQPPVKQAVLLIRKSSFRLIAIESCQLEDSS
ncbi:hypothetical protein AUJ13_01175 [Candidatus Micrarchaeota archaeon CG1_02_49_24]|nr:MAG: hypothetical protein AUJ13_01175 [Candidatus Micrarchaeota archaeon CG1_02_49_24]